MDWLNRRKERKPGGAWQAKQTNIYISARRVFPGHVLHVLFHLFHVLTE